MTEEPITITKLPIPNNPGLLCLLNDGEGSTVTLRVGNDNTFKILSGSNQTNTASSNEEPTGEGVGHWEKDGDNWVIVLDDGVEGKPNEKVALRTQSGTKFAFLGKSLGNNRFESKKNNIWVQNDVTDSPKWVALVNDEGVEANSRVEITKKNGSSQTVVLVAQIKPKVWITAKPPK